MSRDANWWDKAAEIFARASEADPEHRKVMLDEACGGDDDLRREVESLLAQDVNRTGVLEEVAEGARRSNPAAGLSEDGLNPGLPPQIGRYRILGLIAEGGMGAVYEAEQDTPRRVVALKIVRPGLASPEVLRRFQLETEALGRLEHPNIARIYEAGLGDCGSGPQPYFAMERIYGATLTDFAERGRLGVREKVLLMREICDAVQHAHDRGIVHRDLKPGNILVSESGQPKVLDFGIARIADGAGAELATRQTSTGEILGTLVYMSPEQILGDVAGVDARSDVYSLGVMLYELLAGRLPYQVSRRVHDAARVISEEEIAPLGQSRRELRGDLETIAEKALAKDRERRYQSAAELAGDLRRYLALQPIEARRPSLGYRARKYVVRNRTLVVTAAAIFLALIVGLLATTKEAVRAGRAEHAATMELDRAMAAERSATEERDKALRAEADGKAQKAQAEEERNRARQQKERADRAAATAQAVSDFLRQDLLAQAGARQQASPNVKPDLNLTVRTALARAAARIDGRFTRQPEVEAAIRETIADAYVDLSLFGDAEEHYKKALDLRRRTAGPDDPAALETAERYAVTLQNDGRAEEALPLLTHVLDVRRRTLGDKDPLTLATLNDVALAMRKARGAPAEITARLENALSAARAVMGPEKPETLIIMNNLASNYVDLGAYEKAERLYTEALNIRRRVSGADHPSTLLCLNSLGVAQRYQGKYDKAELTLQEAYQRRLAIYGQDHGDTLASESSLGLLYAAERQFDKADELLTRSLESRRKLFGETHPDTLAGMNSLGELREKQGRFEEAETLFARTVEERRKALPERHPNLLNALAALGRARFEGGKYREAEAPLEEAVSGYAQSGARGWRASYAECVLGANQMEMGKYEDAEKRLTAGYEKLAAARATTPFEYRSQIDGVRQWIMRNYERAGRGEAAKLWREK